PPSFPYNVISPMEVGRRKKSLVISHQCCRLRAFRTTSSVRWKSEEERTWHWIALTRKKEEFDSELYQKFDGEY
ncbi:hypothetical protein, partial [Microcoleus sp.]|uniref:hypothetical protein n=1 Tax=Microcoleus sp. TaxID=44472 RepID=UPI0035930DD3